MQASKVLVFSALNNVSFKRDVLRICAETNEWKRNFFAECKSFL